jgi:hypothetical protein
LTVGFAAGYVMGSKAGRERYEQIRAGAMRAWGSDPARRMRSSVQEVAGQATERLRSIGNDMVDLTEAAPAATR